MTEKHYRSNKYVRCYCTKDDEVLVGIKWYRFANTFLLIPTCLLFCVVVLTGTLAITEKVLMIACIVLAPALLARSFYQHAKKEMLLEGHSEECSRKIAYLVMLYAGMWSEFKIMKNKEN